MADHRDKSASELRNVVVAAKPLCASLMESQKLAFAALMREFKRLKRR